MKPLLLILLPLNLWWMMSGLSANVPSPATPHSSTFSANSATLSGVVYHAPDSQAVLPHVLIELFFNGSRIQGTQTDSTGAFSFQGLDYGPYKLVLSGTLIAIDTIDLTIDRPEVVRWIGAVHYETADSSLVLINGVPLLSPSEPEEMTVVGQTLTAADIAQLKTRNVTSIAATTAGVTQNKNSRRGRRAKRARQAPKPRVGGYADMLYTEAPEETTPEVDPGQLTAGVISDHNDWKTWKNVVQVTLAKEARVWALYPTRRYLVQVVNTDRFPQPNALVRLQDAEGATLWEARTDNTGRAELWDQLYTADAKANKPLSVVVEHQGVSQTLKTLVPYTKGPNTVVLAAPCPTFERVDIAWVVDATGSMDDEIAYLQAELGDVIARTQASRPELTFEQASVFYKSEGDDYVTKKEDFTQDVAVLQAFMDGQVADGGTSDEAVEAGLEVAINQLQWHDDAAVKLLFLVLDEPPHDGAEVVQQMQDLIRKAAQKGIRIIPVAASGTDNKTEYLCRAMALATNGHYVFLTDDSGIGGAHKKPVASAYRVELFNDLLVRLIEQATQPPLCEAALLPPLPEVVPTEEPSKTKASTPLRLFPNPSIDRVQVVVPKGVKNILITDMNGRQLEHWQNIPAGTRTWRVEQYPVGIYFLHYMQNGEQKTERLIVSKG